MKLTPQKEFYEVGEPVTLEAIPDPGYEFIEWLVTASGQAASANPTQNPLPIVIDNGTTYTPVFAVKGGASLKVYLPLISQQ